jgi:transcriptional regulator with XRE-family HTH domain
MLPSHFRIRELRDARSWSQLRLAEEAGIRQAALSGIESGKTRRVDLRLLEQIAGALHVSVRDLFAETGRAKRPRGAA